MYSKKFKVLTCLRTTETTPTQWELTLEYKGNLVKAYGRYRSHKLSIILDLIKPLGDDVFERIMYEDRITLLKTYIPKHDADCLSDKSLVLFSKHILDWKSYLSSLKK